MALTCERCPLSTLSRSPVTTSHSAAVPSAEAVAASPPSRPANTTSVTAKRWPLKIDTAGMSGKDVSHTITVPSKDEDASKCADPATG